MNIKELHNQVKEVSAVSLFIGEHGSATSIQLQKNGTLKAHITETPALLLCINGLVTYDDEKNNEVKLESGDYVIITLNVKHWLFAHEVSQLVLLK